MMSPKRLLVTMTSNCARILDEHQRQRVDVEVRGLDRRVFARSTRWNTRCQSACPCCMRVALVGHADTAHDARSRANSKACADDAVHALDRC